MIRVLAVLSGRPVYGVNRRSLPLVHIGVSNPTWGWVFFCCGCCVLSDKGLCDELIACPEESYQLWCVIMRDLETSGWAAAPQNFFLSNVYINIMALA
jgi:hypothetical protein